MLRVETPVKGDVSMDVTQPAAACHDKVNGEKNKKITSSLDIIARGRAHF